jgi:uncharacterized protein YbbC (DUF1343 family)
VVKPGIEVFLASLDDYVGKMRIGLVTNPSAVDSGLRSTLDLLTETGKVSALFALEHGIRGHLQAWENVETTVDERTSLPVFSLYGSTQKPTPEMLQDVDCLVFDLQDVGCRFYTYLYSLLYVMEVASEKGIPIFVLDRPNPLGGEIVSGNILEEDYRSFVGYPVPIRYGLTIGEMAKFFNATRGLHADLTVVTMQGWQRHLMWSDTGLFWVPPSPNMPTTDTVLVYPGTCFLEGTNLSEGRGTCRPFEVIGAPWIDSEDLARELNELKMEGVIFRPVYFRPMFSKYQGEVCGGVQFHVVDVRSFSPITSTVTLLSVIARKYDAFQFLEDASDRPFFDLLVGTDRLRKLITRRDGVGITQLLHGWEQESENFSKCREEFFLY